MIGRLPERNPLRHCCKVTLAGIFVLIAGTLSAQTLSFPSNANLQLEQVSPLGSYAMPVDIWAQGVLPVKNVEGQMTQQAWRIEAQSLTTLQLLRPLREQLRNSRYRIIFECQTEACGGFDFRFGTLTLPPPQMQINIGDFRFLAAERPGADGSEYLSLFVSRTAQAGFVQVTQVGPIPTEDVEPLAVAQGPSVRAAGTATTLSFNDQLAQTGHAILADLSFETGSSQLALGTYDTLQSLAGYLAGFPERSIVLVGHTDASGSLEANIALSKRRAASVLERLVVDYGVPRGQMAAEGVGFLAPVTTNATEEGREANRRVEVMVVQ